MSQTPIPSGLPPATADASRLSGEGSFALLVDSIQDYAIFMLDPEGRVASWNAGAEKIKGWHADEIIGRSFETFYTEDAIESGWPKEELRRAARDGRFEDRGWRVRKDGSKMWANVIITALRGADGALLGFGKVTRDLTEIKRQEEALHQSAEQFRLLVESVKDYAIFMLDPQGQIRTWNAGAVAIHGYTAAEVLNRHVSCVFTAGARQAGRPDRLLQRAALHGRAEEQGWRLRKDGSMFWADVVLTPVMDAQGKLRGFAKVTRDLSEQRRLTELEQAGKRMREFLAMLSHELRNPLAPIRNAVSVMQMQQQLPPATVRARDIVARQIGLLTRLVDDLLDVGRIVNGKILLRSEAIDYRDVVRTSVEAVEPLIQERRHRLIVSLPESALPMWGDPARLAQALQNLLNNAARYTRDGGEIRLAVSCEDGTLVTTVTDTGVGIAADALERIFELFVQESAADGPGNGGLGIGLSLARTLIRQHGGSLTVASEGRDKGSTFTVYLPVGAPPSAAARSSSTGGSTGSIGAANSTGSTVAVAQTAVTVDASPHSSVLTEAAVPGPAADEPSIAGSTSCEVLVVDDNRDSADTMVELLTSLGYLASAAYSGEEALRAARLCLPRLVLMDLNLPDLHGFAVLRRMRDEVGARLAGTRIVAMTGYGQQSDRDSTMQAGFDAHLTKPVDLAQLRTLLRAIGRRDPAP